MMMEGECFREKRRNQSKARREKKVYAGEKKRESGSVFWDQNFP